VEETDVVAKDVSLLLLMIFFLLCPLLTHANWIHQGLYIYIYFALLVAHFWLKRDQRSLVHKTYSLVCLSEVIVS
jgi:hypothetical protein